MYTYLKARTSVCGLHVKKKKKKNFNNIKKGENNELIRQNRIRKRTYRVKSKLGKKKGKNDASTNEM